MPTEADRNWASSDPDNRHILQVEYRAATDIYGIDHSVPASYISSQKKLEEEARSQSSFRRQSCEMGSQQDYF